MALLPRDPVIFIALSFPLHLVAAIPTAILGLQKRVIPELLKDAGASLTNLVLTVLVTDMSSRPSHVGEQVLRDKFTLTFQSL